MFQKRSVLVNGDVRVPEAIQINTPHEGEGRGERQGGGRAERRAREWAWCVCACVCVCVCVTDVSSELGRMVSTKAAASGKGKKKAVRSDVLI